MTQVGGMLARRHSADCQDRLMLCYKLCYSELEVSRTSSFRISDKLHERLDRFARREGRAKNSVIVKAVEIYLDQHERRNLAAEARRQSLLATSAGGDADWLDQADQTGWK